MKKYRLKKESLLIINLLLIIISFIVYDENIHNITSNFIISIIYLLIAYNCNIIYKRILKENK